MFNWIIPWHIFFLLFQAILSSSTNETEQFSLGFFCVYCGQTYSHLKTNIDCTQPYEIFCSSEEAIGCVKYLKIFDYHMEIIKDCLRFTDLPSLDHSCQSEYSSSNDFTREKAFCCNDRPFCNLSFSSFTSMKKWFVMLLLLLLLLYHDFISI